MKTTVLLVGTGLVAGTAGALLTTALTSARASLGPTAPIHAMRESHPSPPIVPPGWDPSFSARLSSVESQLGQVAASAPRAPAAAPSSASASDVDPASAKAAFDNERAQHYQTELAYREQLLAEHDAEPLDRAWSASQGRAVRDALSKGGPSRPFELKDVDCRDATCVATLTFPSPVQALRYLRTPPVAGTGCKGFTSTPTPPSDNGPYELTLFYNCR
jgi:hypothetical protein